MANLPEVASTAEFMRLLAQSNILTAAELRAASGLAQQTQQAKMLARRLVAKGILTRWQAGQLLVGWHKLRLGNYRLCSQIGRSETGRVFLAEHTELRREVAIKTLSRRFTQHREVVERFLEDAREVAALDHRNIRHVFDVDNADDQFFLVMEYVNGTDLQRLVEQQGPLPVNTAAEYVRQAADGLAHAHALGITHRDLCPSNLMVDDKQVVKIVGMGMGRLAEHHADEKAGDDSSRRGSGYIPPEVARGTGPFDGRSDIYALGCAAYYLLTGCAPQSDASQSDASQSDAPQSDASQSGASQSGASSGELSAAEDNALPVDIGELRSDAPPSLVAIVRRMMASVPDERFPTAADVSLALQTWLGADPLERVLPGIPVAAPASEPFEWVPQEPAAAPGSQPDDPPAEEAQEPTVEATERWWETDEWKKWLIVVVVLQVLVFIAAFAMSSWFARRPPDSQSAPMQIMERSQLENDLPDLSDGPQRQVAQAGEVLSARDPANQPPAGGGASSEVSPPAAPAEPAAAMPTSSEVAVPALEASPDAGPGQPGPAKTANEPPADVKQPSGEPSPNETPSNKTPSNETPPKETPSNETPPKETAPAPTPPAKESPPAATPPLNPWRDLPAAVDLPRLAEPAAGAAGSTSLDLGPVDLAAGRAPSAVLLGGNHAGLPAARFELESSGEGDPHVWQFKAVAEEPSEGGGHPAAQIRLAEGRLQFQWLASAESSDAQLCNCAVRLTSGTDVHEIRLRTPVKADPLSLSNKKRPRYELDLPPDPKWVRLQINSVTAPLPAAFALEPAEPIEADGDTVTIRLPEDPDERVLLLEIRSTLKGKSLRLDCDAYFQLNEQVESKILNPKNLRSAQNTVVTNQDQANNIVQTLRAQVGRLPEQSPQRKLLEARQAEAEAVLAKCSAESNRMNVLMQLREALAGGAAVNFRLFYLAEDCEVELLRSF